MRVSATKKTRRSLGWKGPSRSAETEWSGSTWTRCWTRYAPTRASTTSCAASACPPTKRSSPIFLEINPVRRSYSDRTVPFLFRPELGLGLDAFFALPLADLAALDIAAFDGALRRFVPLRQPVAERIPEPRRLRVELRQAELLPDFPRALHVFALGQRERRHVALHRGVHEERGILFPAVLALGAVALAAVRQRLHVLERVHAVCHRPLERVGVVRIDVVAHRDCDLAHVALE